MSDLLPVEASLRTFCTFRLEGRLYGIEVFQVKEVSPHLPITPVPQTSPAVRGLFNLRSRIYLALDLRPMLGFTRTECTAETRLMILKNEVAQDVGVLVEQGGDIVHVRSDMIEPAGAGDSQVGSLSPVITGVCKLKNELLMVVDLSNISELIPKLHSEDRSATPVTSRNK